MMMRPGAIYRGLTDTVKDPFSADTTGLPDATSTQLVELPDGGTFDLSAGPVRKRLGEAVVRMLAYNGSIPGPTLKVAQGAEATINFTNQADVETTVHWHGLRLDNRYDGVPHGRHRGMQAPIPVGGGFAYRLRFPEPLQMIADATFDEVPHPYALVVPGGRIPTVRAMSDPAIRAYVRAAADSAETVASVCTGSLILAAVGLLDGRKATTNWFWYGVLGQFGARHVQARWVEDGKFIMSAGVSAGIDMALVLVSRLTDEATARRVQLALDYDPQPPFGGIDWPNVPLQPRVIRGGIRLAAPWIAARPRWLTQLDRQRPVHVPSPSTS